MIISNYFSTANTGAKEYCIKNVVIYKVFSDADMPEIEEQNNIELLDLHKFQANGTAPVDEPVIYNEDGSMTLLMPIVIQVQIFLYLNI